MWSDNETNVDLLDLGHLVSAVTSIVRRDALLPATIGVFGDWGSGKSSLLQMVNLELEKHSDTLCLTFNGWLFEGYEDAKTALMGSIIEQMLDKRKWNEKAKDWLSKLAKRVDKMKLASLAIRHGGAFLIGGPAGLGISIGWDLFFERIKSAIKPEELDNIKELLKAKEGDDSKELRKDVLEFRRDFTEMLKETALKRLVVIIDDLDRCNPATIIETLEAIKLFLFVPATAFILGADERLIRYAVRTRFPELPGERAEVGRDYLEKLVQFPIRVPALGPTEIESYINLLFVELSDLTQEQKTKIREASIRRGEDQIRSAVFDAAMAQSVLGRNLPEGLTERMALAAQVAPLLTGGLNGNPRQCKRFLNMMLMRIGMAEARGISLQARVLVKLMVLEYMRSETLDA